ncbi:hypothetical protein WAA20_00080 [Butyrivibrio fibrisolvens]|uniref:hypothetical protein n=1 Tax=Butyrivibrio fibrisolvens TaxID=831 RepID=UPI001FA8ECA6|nr:hypothetical protein [Butyrivibrio fibrisolvens]
MEYYHEGGQHFRSFFSFLYNIGKKICDCHGDTDYNKVLPVKDPIEHCTHQGNKEYGKSPVAEFKQQVPSCKQQGQEYEDKSK